MHAQATSYFRSLLLYSFLVLFCTGCYAQIKDFKVISNDQCTLKITQFNGNTVTLLYQTLPANQAGLNKNSLWLWRSSEVPWNYPPEKMQILPADATESGSYVFDDVLIAEGVEYIACYAVDSTVKRICACAVIGKNSDASNDSSVSMTLLKVRKNSLSLSYNTLAGYLPKTYQNWVGLWKGEASPYNAPKPMATGKPLDNSNSGTITLNDLTLQAGQTYTLIYFLGKNKTDAAVIITFKAV